MLLCLNLQYLDIQRVMTYGHTANNDGRLSRIDHADTTAKRVTFHWPWTLPFTWLVSQIQHSRLAEDRNHMFIIFATYRQTGFRKIATGTQNMLIDKSRNVITTATNINSNLSSKNGLSKKLHLKKILEMQMLGDCCETRLNESKTTEQEARWLLV